MSAADYPPGFWVDDDGTLHVSVEDILRSKGIPVTPDTVAEAERNVMAALAEQLPNADVEVAE